MKKIITLLILLLTLNSCIIDENIIDKPYDIKKLIKSEIIYIDNNDNEYNKQIINDLKLNELITIDEKELYNQIKILIEKPNITKYKKFKTITYDDYQETIICMSQTINRLDQSTIYVHFIKYKNNNIYHFTKYNGEYTTHNVYKWSFYGFTFDNNINFNLKTFIYFKILNNENNIQYVKIPMNIKGNINIQKEICDFNFIVQ